MKRSRPGRSRATFKSVARKVPPPSSRRGHNSRQEEDARKDRLRSRRAGAVRRFFGLMRTAFAAAFLLAALGAGGWASYQAYQRNDFLALRTVDVTGNRLWDRNVLLEKAGVELGMKLPTLSVPKVEAALRSLPGVADVKVRRIFPSRLEIRVSEQEPVGMGRVRSLSGSGRSAPGQGWRGLAPDGTALPGLDLRESDLPVIDGFGSMGAAARAQLGSFLDGAKREYPSLYANFSQLAWRDGDVEIFLRDGGPLGSGGQKVILDATNKSLNSLEFLQALMRQQGGALEAGKTIDMRVEGYAYVR